MFGQGCLPPSPGFWLGFAGTLGLLCWVLVVPDGVELVVVVVVVEASFAPELPVALVVVPVVVVDGEAAAPAMPATAPPVASAPATIVAPSILEMVMSIKPPGSGVASMSSRVRGLAKRRSRRGVGVV